MALFIWKKRTAIIFLALCTILNPFIPVRAEEPGVHTAATVEEKTALEEQLAAIEKEIAAYEAELSHIGKEKKTLTTAIQQLKKKQSVLSARIKQTTLLLQETQATIQEIEGGLRDAEEHLEKTKQNLGAVIQRIYFFDQDSPIERMAARPRFSDFLDTLKNYQTVMARMKDLSGVVTQTITELDQKRIELDEQQTQQHNLIAIARLQNQEFATTISAQNDLLKATKGREQDYQALLKESEAQALAIRNRIYDLLGVSRQLTFGEALEIAEWASGHTGVRPAFLLAVITQESNLGKNVGTCNRLGDPPEKSWRVIMKPERDQEPFKTITTELGIDIDTTPVSCPMRGADGKQIGWGGAMGPAQFIPSTWMGYRGKVTAVTGKPANPWDIRDAFLASAIKLKADGAGSESGEWAAAMRYFSGGTNTKYRFYGDQVTARAKAYQEDIDAL